MLFDRRAIYAKLEEVGVPVPKHVVLQPGRVVVDEQEVHGLKLNSLSTSCSLALLITVWQASLLGEGTFGATHRMRSKEDGMLYAVKMMRVKKVPGIDRPFTSP